MSIARGAAAATAVFVTAVLGASGLTASATASPAAPTAAEALVLGQKAYDYGFPLLEFLRVRREMTSVACPDGRGNSPVNSFSHARGFAGADDRTVVAPNTDTLYSITHLDLGKGPVTLSNPRMGKRYFSFALLDPYTNVIAIPGQLENGGGAAARYVVRWTKGRTIARKGGGLQGGELIRSKYRRVWVIGRTLATDARSDQRKAKRKMRRYGLELPNGKPRRFPKGCEPGEPQEFPTPTDGPAFIAALNRAIAQNPPPKRDGPLLEALAPLGVGPGLSPEQAGLSPEVLTALYAGVTAEAASLPTQAKLKALTEAQKNDGWYLPPLNIGDYGTDYAYRAMIASVGLGANTPEEAIYPAGITDRDGALYNGANDYRLTFGPGNEPPAKFFWSLTMYDSDGYLIANPIDRYSLGPSHPPLLRKPDGSIVIAISRTEPEEADVNWLPAPAGGFRLNLRLYGPSRAAQTGGWKPPGVVRLIG
jgi:hypothetical protein